MSVAPFLPSAEEIIIRMLDIAELKAGETLYDLGCGDGRILIIAAQEYGAKAVGIELNPDLASKAKINVKSHRLEERVHIVNKNFFDVDFSPAHVVTMYLTQLAADALQTKFKKELHKGTRIVSHNYEVGSWRPELISGHPSGHRIILYRM